MQTFLPLPDFAATAASLDRARLGKQRVENLQILKAMVIPGYGWAHHPAVKMWAEWKPAFYAYHRAIIHEWVTVRGYKDTCLEKFERVLFRHFELNPEDALDESMPFWVGDGKFHLAHQSNLIRKMPEHYALLFPGVPDDLEYVWPVN